MMLMKCKVDAGDGPERGVTFEVGNQKWTTVMSPLMLWTGPGFSAKEHPHSFEGWAEIHAAGPNWVRYWFGHDTDSRAGLDPAELKKQLLRADSFELMKAFPTLERWRDALRDWDKFLAKWTKTVRSAASSLSHDEDMERRIRTLSDAFAGLVAFSGDLKPAQLAQVHEDLRDILANEPLFAATEHLLMAYDRVLEQYRKARDLASPLKDKA